jgi:hypothetical protein
MDLFFHFYKDRSWFKNLHNPDVLFEKNEKKREVVKKSCDLFVEALKSNTPIMLKVYECLPSEIGMSLLRSSSYPFTYVPTNVPSSLLPPSSSSLSAIRPTPILPLSSFFFLGDDPESHTLAPSLLLSHWLPPITFPSHLPFFAVYIEECPEWIGLILFYFILFYFILFMYLFS